MQEQKSLDVFLTHEDGKVTITYITLALRKEPNGTMILYLTMEPKQEADDIRPVVVRPEVSVAHCIELVTAEISGRLVRDFTRQGRVP